jgi:metal-sulfur cluster biosynthetic enzyme
MRKYPPLQMSDKYKNNRLETHYMVANISKDKVIKKLDDVIDPCSNGIGFQHSIIDMGMLDEVTIEDNHVRVFLHLTSPHCTMVPYFIDKIENGIMELPDVQKVTLHTDNGLQWKPTMMDQDAYDQRMDRIDKND